MKTLLYGAFAAFLAAPVSVFAQAQIPGANQTLLREGPGGVANLIITIGNWLFTLLLILAVVFIILAAYRYLFSGGSEEGVSTAHKMLIYAVVAVAVAMLSRGIVFVIGQLVTTGGGSSGGSSFGGGNDGNLNINLNTRYGGVNVNVPIQ